MTSNSIIKVLSKPVNISLLALLSTGPKYPRVLARLLGKSEAFIVRNLKELEREGLVESYWLHVGGRNVKMYRLRTSRIVISFETGNVKVAAEDGSEKILLNRSYSDPVPDPGIFVDRIREIEALRSTPGVSFVWGPMGIGKTSLAAILASSKDARLWINCTQLTLPDEVARRIALFLADNGLPPPPGALAHGASEAAPLLAERLDALDAIVVLDDFHKPIEREALYDLLERLDEGLKSASILVLSREPPEMIPSRGLLVPLGPLPYDSARALLDLLGVELDEDAARWLYDAAAGNPGLLTAMARLVAAGYTPQEAGSGALEGALSKILASLGHYEYTMLTAASVFLSPPTVEELAELTGVSSATVYVSKLASKGLVKLVDGRVVVHDAIKDYVEKRDPRATARLHRRLAKRLLESDSRDDMFRAIYHYWRAGDYVEALDALEKYNSLSLAVPSYYRGVFLKLLSSIPLSSLNPYYRLLLQFYRAASLTDGEEAARLLVDAAREAEKRDYPRLSARLYAAAAYRLFTAGKPAPKYLEKALEFLRRDTGQPDTRLYIYTIRVLHRSGRLEEAVETARRYLERAAEPHDKALAHHFLAVLMEAQWRPEEALRHLDEAIANYEETPILSNLAIAYNDKGFLLYQLGRAGEAREALERAVEIAHTCGDAYTEAEALTDLAQLHMDEGGLEEADRLLGRAEDIASASSDAKELKPYIAMARARLLAAQGELAEAEGLFDAACRGLAGRHAYHYARCLTYYAFLIANRDKKRACRLLREAAETYRMLGNSEKAGLAEERAARLCRGG